MRIVLTDKDLDTSFYPKDVIVKKITYHQMELFNHNSEVCIIAGSRKMSNKANQMDLPGLRFFQLTSAGFDGVPIKELMGKGVLISNVGSTYSIPIAETVVYGLLMMAKKLHSNPNNRHIKIQRHYNELSELFEKRVMILGAGSIGTEIAKRLSGFEMIVNGYAQKNGDRPFFNSIICDRQILEKDICNYDYIISTLPDNRNTQGFIDMNLITKMHCSAIFVNVGRTNVINQEDLYRALKKKYIGGAVLDMFEKLPNPITNRFRRLNNVIVLPGVAAISQEAAARLKRFCSDNIYCVLQSKTPICIICEGE